MILRDNFLLFKIYCTAGLSLFLFSGSLNDGQKKVLDAMVPFYL